MAVPRLHKEVSIFDPGNTIEDGIADASSKADSYITDVTGGGIFVHQPGQGPDDTQTPTGWHIADALEYVKSGVTRFWIGLKDAVHDLTPTVIIGKPYVSGASDNESHMELDYHSLQLIDREGSAYFHVSDLRDESGVAELTASFILSSEDYSVRDGYGYIQMFGHVSNMGVVAFTSVSIDNTPISEFEAESGMVIKLYCSPLPQVGQPARVTFTTRSSYAKAYTIGRRRANRNIGAYSVAVGLNCIAGEYVSYAEGVGSAANGSCSHAEGNVTTASGDYSHSEGEITTASGDSSHSEGYITNAIGTASHAEGIRSVAGGRSSHAQNLWTIAKSDSQTALGKYNVEDANGTYAAIIGNGTADDARSNALAVDWSGNVLISGTLTQNSDRRLKEHVSYLSEDACEFVRNLKPALYEKDGGRHVGFYAQDVQDADRWGTEMVTQASSDESLGFDTLSLEYTSIIAPLVAYCQSLERRIAELE